MDFDLEAAQKSLKLDITFKDYVATSNGLFNFAETYATHQCFGTLAYVSGAMMLVSDEDNLTMAGMISMVVGACHFFHLIHLFFKIYV
ncbi:uncharacterized protein LOC144107942 isoform X3 [Amblyomma americanum]